MAHEWLKLSDVPDSKITPMLRQYIEAKAASKDSILFFRMGDFYEMFFEDAIEAAGILGLALTSRDGAEVAARVPMCGVPHRAVDSYVARLIRAGRTVTLCDQIEDPKLAKGIVKRAVIRTITPGTVIEPELLDAGANNYLGAWCPGAAASGLAFVDVSTGEFLVAAIAQSAARGIDDELTRMAPAEVLVSENVDAALVAQLETRFPGTAFTRRPDDAFDHGLARSLLLDHFGLGTLKGIGLDDAAEAAAAAGAALSYIRETQRGAVPHLQFPRRYHPSDFVVLDGNTQHNLELIESMAGKRKEGSLLGVLDRTQTKMGGRKLRQWLLHPLVDVNAIRARLDVIEELEASAETRLQLKELFRGVADLERLLGRLTSRTGNARDLNALGNSLEVTPHVKQLLANAAAPLLGSLCTEMDELADVTGWIRSAIVDAPPLAITDGGIIRTGHDAELDRLHTLVSGGRDWIATLQRQECARTGIPNLKVGYNKIFGYYIEVSKGNASLVPDTYERKQTLVNAERFVTPELKSREEEIVTAQERMQKLEYDLFTALRERVCREAARIQKTAGALASLDVLDALADVAAANDYCKPDVDDSGMLVIREGRHPVVEDLMRRGEFVPNDTVFDPENATLQIVTGPNMAGKSTYLRQVALIALMAQAGSFVPAAKARIGVVDRIFTRVGASDNLVRGESTFMVEMVETANILNTATERSLIVLDEIGRGTSTFDGISIAWSVAEHIHDRIHAKTLFATHYHELTDLGEKLEHAKNLNVAVREWNGKVVFLYRIVDGGADHSYGIQVAKLAGLPPKVITRARAILESLEAGNAAAAGLPQQMYLFGPQHASGPSPIEKELEGVEPDALTPRQAQDLLYHLKHLLNKPRQES